MNKAYENNNTDSRILFIRVSLQVGFISQSQQFKNSSKNEDNDRNDKHRDKDNRNFKQRYDEPEEVYHPNKIPRNIGNNQNLPENGNGHVSDLAKSTPTKDVSPLIQSRSPIKFHTKERFVIPFNYADVRLKNNSAIVIDLKVGDNELIIINNSTLKLGITSLQVIKAKSIPTDISKEEIDNHFDSYDITVKISSSIHSLATNIDDIAINCIIISITAIEVDSLQVIQVERVEKILIEGYSSASFNENKFELRVRHWLRCSPKFIIILFAAFWLTFISAIFFMIVASAYQKYSLSTTNPYQPIPTK
ncbi:10012_t:CDS:2 [Entrophospora sp. SA101]|nr:392_t:CDS:2 [Entrophospora sp. SA101]CAJ0643716.1 10012_t:CDS:2 [Entrophospora sp. SA101]CAJ0840756.1 2397_t:CDS:2 [Entrophospora sp. SA101]